MLEFNRQWPDVRVGDTYFILGHCFVSLHEWEKVKKTPWYKELARHHHPHFASIFLQNMYDHFCRVEGKEPPWTENVSPRMKRFLRMGWLQSDNFDPLAILPYRNELGFSFSVHDDDLIHKVSSALNVFRLGQIRQLGFLHDPVMNELVDDCSGIGMLFEHTRYMHSLTVMATASLMSLNCGLNDHDMLHLRVAALTHDVLTPAGGDSIKFIDPDAFDEDAHYPEIFKNNPEWDRVRVRFSLDEELLAEIVRGEGILGRLLDLADKTSYVAHDLDAYMMDNDPRTFQYFKSPASIMEIWRFQSGAGHPLCNLWDCVVIKNDQVVVTDGGRLAEFLKLRALMFHHLYYNPKARYREQMLGILIVEPLYRKGVITREQLIKTNDQTLYGVLNYMTGCKDLNWALARSDVAPEIESYPNLDIARARVRELVFQDNPPLVMFEEFPAVSVKATQYLVQTRDGEIASFAEAYPEETAEILRLGSDLNPAKVYVLPIEKMDGIISPEIQKVLLERQRERIDLG